MTPSSAPFPNHQFDFGDLVFVLPLQQNGTVEGISHRREAKAWSYLVRDSQNESWWQEEQLSFAAQTGLAARAFHPRT